MGETDYLITGHRVGVRDLRAADCREYIARVRESAELHHPWVSPPATAEEFNARLGTPGRRGYAVCELATGGIAAGVAINNIVYGSFRCGALGYSAFAHAAGRGLTREGIGLVIRHAFDPGGLGLHRLEANVQPANDRSRRLVRGLGFRLEGLSPDFLFVDGAWRDHERWAITSEMPLAGARPADEPAVPAQPPSASGSASANSLRQHR
ncbi:GNAT family N-acetyltransferase [Streptomyces sp. TP-A0874]|uniref:GNAT family N-acetyltransferase n=1 Tax=Streptomyces sp. TP-A0874 TaxID=549819 RepID=UPI000852CB7A|nr:GNAT family protein [Streptomyces sp. TP-A0874]